MSEKNEITDLKSVLALLIVISYIAITGNLGERIKGTVSRVFQWSPDYNLKSTMYSMTEPVWA